jgi:hypothetical protein
MVVLRTLRVLSDTEHIAMGSAHGRLPVELFGVSTDKKCRGDEVGWGKRINAGRAPRSATTRPMDCVHTITVPISDPDGPDGETGHPSN